MEGRNLKKDKSGNEWMIGSQFKRALLEDFEVKVSVSLIYAAVKDQKIPATCQKKVLGKKAYNYTQAVIPFLEMSPAIAPSGFKTKAKNFRSKQAVKARATIPTTVINPKIMADIDKDDEELSVAIEKARHEKIKREKAEFEFNIIKGNYLDIETIAEILATIAIETRQSVHAIRPRVRTIFAAEESEHKIDHLLGKELDIALNNLGKLSELAEGSFAASEERRIKEEEENG